MANESSLEVLIRVVQEGNGDKKAIESLKEIAVQGKQAAEAVAQIGKSSDTTEASLQKINNALKKSRGANVSETFKEIASATKSELGSAVESVDKTTSANGRLLDSIKILGGRTGETFLRGLGVPPDVLLSLKGTQIGLEKLEKGMFLATAANLGLVAVFGLTISKTQELAASLDAASEGSIQSSKDLNFVLEARAKRLEELGLATSSTTDDILAFNAAQAAAFEALTQNAAGRERGLEEIGFRGRFAGAAASGQARVQTLGIQARGVGLSGAAAIENERELARAEAQNKISDAALKTTSTVEKQALLEENLKASQEALALIVDKNSKQYKEQEKTLEGVKKQLQETNRELDLARQNQKNVTDEARAELALREKQLAIKQTENTKKDQEKRAEGLEKEKGIAEQFNDALQDAFVLEVKLKGIEDDRTAKAIAYLQATGRTAEAARLTTLELEKQKNSLSGLTPGQQAGKKLAAGGLDVEGLAGTGKTLSERSTLRNLGSQFQREIQSEERRIKKSGVTDEAAVQQQLSGFAEQRLAASPTLSKALGLPAEGQKPATEKEREALISSAEIGKQKEEVSKELQSLGKIESEFFKDFKSYSSTTAKEIEGAKSQIKALEERIKARP